jgi:hypothetical protein
MFWRDHAPPHFHVYHGGREAVIDIDRLRLHAGDLSPRALALTLEWAALHQDELRENWDLCARKLAPRKISPLA